MNSQDENFIINQQLSYSLYDNGVGRLSVADRFLRSYSWNFADQTVWGGHLYEEK